MSKRVTFLQIVLCIKICYAGVPERLKQEGAIVERLRRPKQPFCIHILHFYQSACFDTIFCWGRLGSGLQTEGRGSSVLENENLTGVTSMGLA